MTIKEISAGVVHEMPPDLHKALIAKPKVLALWENITPLARNEFICWIESAKHIRTRDHRIQRTCEALLEGKRRPCCWMGCVHRTDKSISSSIQWILNKQSKSS